jgi:hypothetical protein
MMQMHYFYEISKSGLVSCTKDSGWPESRDGLPLFTEMPGRVEPIKKLEHTGEPDRREWIIPGELHV